MSDEKSSDRIRLENDIYAVLCKYLPQHEVRGFNFHTRSQNIAEHVGNEYDHWVKQNYDLRGHAGSVVDDQAQDSP